MDKYNEFAEYHVNPCHTNGLKIILLTWMGTLPHFWEYTIIYR